MSRLKNCAVSASRGSTVVFIFGVVVALVGAMMLFAPAGLAQEDPEAAEASVGYDDESDVDALTEEIASVEKAIEEDPASDEDASDAAELFEEPVVVKDLVSVERDGDIDTVTIDDTDFSAWRDSETDVEKVSDDELYGISRESDAEIDEIVEVEADGDVVDEDAYGFIYDDEAELEKIVIDYNGLKTTPPEMLTVKVKSSEEGEYSVLDADDVPAKADVQDAGFLPDPSAEEQEKIDKVKKENRAADTESGTRRLETDAPTVESGAGSYPILKSAIGGEYTQTTMFVNKIVVRDKRGTLTQGLAGNREIIAKKKTHTCRLNSTNVEVLEETDGKASLIAIDTSSCNTGANDRKLDIWEGQSTKDVISVQLQASNNSRAGDFDVYLFASADADEKAGDVQIPGGIPASDEWTEDVDNGTLTTKTEALGTRGDFKVTMAREFDKGGDIASDVTAQVKHINGAFLDNNVMSPKLKVLNADGSVIKELEGKAGEAVGVQDDLSGNKWGGVTFSQDVEGVTVPNGGKIVVEMGFRKKSGAAVKDDLNMQPLGPGSLKVDLASSDKHFDLKTAGDIEATARVISRDNPYEDHIKIASRSKFEGATVTVYAPGNILQPWKASNYSFDILSDDEGRTGIQDGYGLKADVKDINGDQVIYEVYPVKDRKRVSSAVIEAGTSIAVRSAFSGEPSTVETTVALKGEKIAQAADSTWKYANGVIENFPIGALEERTINGETDSVKNFGFNGASAPFILENGKTSEKTFGGICLEPYRPYPTLITSTDPKDWTQYSPSQSPAGGSIPIDNQKALSYLVNELHFEASDEADAVRKTELKMQELASKAGFPGLDVKEAFSAVYGAILNLAGWDFESIDREYKKYNKLDSPGRRTTMERGEKIADWVLDNIDLDNAEINYQILRPAGGREWNTGAGMELRPFQMVIVPGRGGPALSTTATLEEGNFGEYRVQKAALNETATAIDRVEFQGLDSSKQYKLKTEIFSVDEKGNASEEPVYRAGFESDVVLTADEIRAGFKDVTVDLASIKDKLSVGRYVFFETVVDSAGNEVVKHKASDDLAQSFWIEEPTKEIPSSAGFQLRKVAADDKHLVSGAEFIVADSANLSKAGFKEAMKSLDEANGNGANYVIDGLQTGKDYWVFETKAPGGENETGKNYQLLAEPLRFMLTEEGLKFWDKSIAPSGDYTANQTFPVVEKSTVPGDHGSVIGVATVANVWIGDLPKTGGNGIAPWLLLGGLIMAAGALMGNRRRA